jgi:hypothetical protein
MTKPRKRTHRGLHLHNLAEGYRMLKSPLAASFHAAADHYNETDPAIDPPHNESVARKEKQDHD